MVAPSQPGSDPDGGVRADLAGLAPWTADLAHLHDRRWSLAAAQRYCQELVRTRDPNAAVWLGLFGQRRSQTLFALAAFARIIDDLADEEEFAAVRVSQLDALESALGEARRGSGRHPVLVAVVEVEREFDLPAGELSGLIRAARVEVAHPEVADWDDLLRRAQEQIAPLGRLVLAALGRDRPDLCHWADLLSAALYVTTRLQNLSVDLARGRTALPADQCAQLGVSPEDLRARRSSRPVGELIHHLAGRTRWMYREAYPLVVEVGLPGTLPLAGLWLGGRSVLRMVDRAGAGLLRSRPAVGPLTLAWALAGAGLDRLPGVGP